jgi:hypothetical protein
MKKNTKTKQNKELTSSPEQPAVERQYPFNLARRRANQSLGIQELLALLRREAPGFYSLAEVVGKWVWIQFQDKQPADVTRALAEFGFHWNRLRQTWQHRCGTQADHKDFDPRKRYRSHFAADEKAA